MLARLRSVVRHKWEKRNIENPLKRISLSIPHLSDFISMSYLSRKLVTLSLTSSPASLSIASGLQLPLSLYLIVPLPPSQRATIITNCTMELYSVRLYHVAKKSSLIVSLSVKKTPAILCWRVHEVQVIVPAFLPMAMAINKVSEVSALHSIEAHH